MAPKQTYVSAGRPQKGLWSTISEEYQNPENTTIVRSIMVFTAGVAFLHSSFGEFLLPPM